MKHYVFVYSLAFLVVGAGCRATGAPQGVGSGPEEIAAWADGLMRAENARPRDLGFQETYDLAYRVARREVEKLANVAALKAAAYALEVRERELHQRLSASPEAEVEDPFEYWCTLLRETEHAIRHRLAGVGTAEAAEALVSLFADPILEYDGESALSMQVALCVCGRPALPFLRRIVDGPRVDWARRIVGLIARGERGI